MEEQKLTRERSRSLTMGQPTAFYCRWCNTNFQISSAGPLELTVQVEVTYCPYCGRARVALVPLMEETT